MALTSRSAIRGVAPHDVVDAVEEHLDHAGLKPARTDSPERLPEQLDVTAWRDGWTVITWPEYFAPRDVAAGRALSRGLQTVVSTITTTEDEGWSHVLLGCGIQLDQYHSYPAGLAWDDVDLAVLAAEWSGDFELVARVLDVDARTVRRHFCQATPARPDHPGRERDGYLALWAALGIRPPVGDAPPHAVLDVEPAWHRVS